MISMLTAVLWFTVLACSPDPCVHDADCPERCINGVCVTAECNRNSDCPYGERCSDLGCVSGCDVDEDCAAGDICSAGECQRAECQQTSSDCEYAERCVEGACLAEDFPHCEPCGYSDWQTSPNGVQECILYNLSAQGSCDWQQNSGCEGDQTCFPADGQGLVDEGICLVAYWFKPCTTTMDCARPFVCRQDVYGDGSDIGVCWAECPFWRAEGVFGAQ